MNVRGYTIQFASAKKKRAEKDTREWTASLEKLERDLPDSSDIDKDIAEIAKLRDQIKTVQDRKVEACMFRTHQNWMQFGEKNSAYFFALEKRNYNRKCISQLKLPDGSITHDFKTILDEQGKFYEKLYEDTYLDQDHEFVVRYLQSINDDQVNKVKNADRFALEQEMTIHEIYDAIMTMKVGKCPGIDGIPVEFYKKFWNQIKHLMTELFSEIYREEEFHLSARRSVISPIDKPDKDLLYLDNWRPISLMNTDFWDKIVANRLLMVLPYVIEPYQTGFMKGRTISENIAQLMSVIEHFDDNNIEVIVLSYDF